MVVVEDLQARSGGGGSNSHGGGGNKHWTHVALITQRSFLYDLLYPLSRLTP